MRFLNQIDQKLKRLKEVERALQDPACSTDPTRLRELGKELRDLQKIDVQARRLKEVEAQLEESEVIAEDAGSAEDMKDMAQAEIVKLTALKRNVLTELENLLVEKDPRLQRNAIIEIRAGTGGLEASLFAADIFRMYNKFASNHRFKVEVLSHATTEAGGIREVIFLVSGEGVFGQFRFESGVHRVQRVPATEASGRIHTSAVTVAVLPEAEEVEVQLKPEDLKIDVFRSGGPGGQSVNTTDSAVRITHVPSGVTVKCQDEKSQLKNKLKAMKILRARIYDQIQSESQKKMAKARKDQVGSGDRSEKIRTYNFPERRVTDHRIGLTLHTLDRILEGDLDPVIQALIEKEDSLGT